MVKALDNTTELETYVKSLIEKGDLNRAHVACQNAESAALINLSVYLKVKLQAKDVAISAEQLKTLKDTEYLYWCQARLTLSDRNIDDALELVLKGIYYYPESMEGKLILSNILRMSQKFTESIKVLKTINGLTYFKNDYNTLLAMNYEATDEVDLASEHYIKVIESNLDNDNLTKKLLVYLLKHNRFQTIDRVLQLTQNHLDHKVEIYFQTWSAIKQSNINELLRIANESYTIFKDDITTTNKFGSMLFENKKYKKAASLYLQSIEIKPKQHDILLKLILCYLNNYNFEAALLKLDLYYSIFGEDSASLNLHGLVLNGIGDYENAIAVYKKGLKHAPNDYEIHNNIATAYYNASQLEHAKSHYLRAIDIFPKADFLKYNLFGCCTSLNEATAILGQIEERDITLSAISTTKSAILALQSEEIPDLFKADFKSDQNPVLSSFKWIFNLTEFADIEFCFNRWQFFDFLIANCDKTRPFYEFGVWRGVSFRYLAERLSFGFGFDTFEGLPIAWHAEPSGNYSASGLIPSIKNGIFIKGEFKRTLKEFFSETRELASIINFDADLYESTKIALSSSIDVVDEGTILIFDEFLMNATWKEDEFKALEEHCEENDFGYRVIAVCFFTKQVAVRIVGID